MQTSERAMHEVPRFSRGQETNDDRSWVVVGPNFARGQSRRRVLGRAHKGEFATGQEVHVHHPEWDYAGRFSRGQEQIG